MANEVTVFEQQTVRIAVPIMVTPFLEKQTVSIGAASANFGLSTAMITVNTTTACKVEIGPNADGTGHTIPIAANTHYHFSVVPGHRLYAVA